MWLGHHGAMPVGVIDVGSNTVRLHVSRGRRGGPPREGDAPARRVDRAVRLDPGRRSSPRPPHCVERVRRATPASSASSGSRCSSRAPGGRPRTATSCSRASRLPQRACPSGCSRPQEEGRLAFLGAVAGDARALAQADRRLRRRRRLGADRGRHASRRASRGCARSTSARCGSRAGCSTTTRPATLRSRAARDEVDRHPGRLPSAAARDRARGRRQRPRAPLDRRQRRSAPTSSTRWPGSWPARRRRRSSSSTGSSPSASGRSPPARSSSARSRSGSPCRSASCAAASAKAPRSSSRARVEAA